MFSKIIIGTILEVIVKTLQLNKLINSILRKMMWTLLKINSLGTKILLTKLIPTTSWVEITRTLKRQRWANSGITPRIEELFSKQRELKIIKKRIISPWALSRTLRWRLLGHIFLKGTKDHHVEHSSIKPTNKFI